MLRSPCFIISDVHLGAAPPETEPALLGFLRHLRGRAQSLVINGDLFDFWFEWRRVIPRTGFRTLAALAELAEAGVDVLWVAGNHDCWGGDMLRREVGVRYHVGTWRGAIAGWKALVDHGDGLRDREDRKYRMLRAVIRHRASVAAFRLLHPDMGSRLASSSSEASRTYVARDGGAGLRAVALDRLAREPDLELVVFGHSHVPVLEQVPAGGTFANAGTWMGDSTYLRVDEDAITLHRWRRGQDGGASAESDCLHAVHRRPQEAAAER